MVTQAVFVGQIGNLRRIGNPPALDFWGALRCWRVRVKRALNGPTDHPRTDGFATDSPKAQPTDSPKAQPLLESNRGSNRSEAAPARIRGRHDPECQGSPRISRSIARERRSPRQRSDNRSLGQTAEQFGMLIDELVNRR